MKLKYSSMSQGFNLQGWEIRAKLRVIDLVSLSPAPLADSGVDVRKTRPSCEPFRRRFGSRADEIECKYTLDGECERH
jgi:hypothetical protein